MRGLVPAVEKHEWRSSLTAPFEVMKAVVAQDNVVRPIGEAFAVRDSKIGGTLAKAREFRGVSHVQRFHSAGKYVQVHGCGPSLFGCAANHSRFRGLGRWAILMRCVDWLEEFRVDFGSVAPIFASQRSAIQMLATTIPKK